MPEIWQHAGFGAYVHWPFCAAKCPYCDFNSHVVRSVDHDRWRRAFVSDIQRQAEITGPRVLSSIFFGGGTPSLMEAATVDTVVRTLQDHYTFANDIEITLEANPSSVDASRFADYAAAGVNRVSLGIQALNDRDLQRLGRLHSHDEAMRALDVARAQFKRVSFDLIYARQDQSPEDWKDELQRALSYGPDHLSLYQLTIEDGTAFGDRFAAGKLRGLPTDEQGAEMYEITQSICESAGLPAYEVSNHAEPGNESRHNLIYWRSGDYLGIGPGAHGRITLGKDRYETATARMPEAWLRSVEDGQGATMEKISPDGWGIEMVMMGLRLNERFDLKHLRETTGTHLPKSQLKSLSDEGLITFDDETLIVTDKGKPLLNAVLLELLKDA